MTKEENLADMCAREIRRKVMRNAPAHTPKNLPESGEELLDMPIDEFHGNIETAYGKPMTCSQMPLPPTHKECEQAYKSAMKVPWHEYVRRGLNKLFS